MVRTETGRWEAGAFVEVDAHTTVDVVEEAWSIARARGVPIIGDHGWKIRVGTGRHFASGFFGHPLFISARPRARRASGVPGVNVVVVGETFENALTTAARIRAEAEKVVYMKNLPLLSDHCKE